MPEKKKSLSRLRRQLEALAVLPTDRKAPEFDKWNRGARLAIEKAFGENSQQRKDFGGIYFSLPIANQDTTNADHQQWHERGLGKARVLLEAFISEIEEYWEDELVDADSNAPSSASRLKVFISHRSTDELLAKAVADLFRDAMRLSATEIRCTSVDGYRLHGGADTDAELRSEVLGVPTFVGIITPTTMNSPYVLFELGARWGAGKHLCPVLARGADAKDLGGPLGGKNALHLSMRAEVVQMMEEIAVALNQPLERASALQQAIDDVVKLASDNVLTVHAAAEQVADPELDIQDVEVEILSFLATEEGSRESADGVRQALKLGLEKVRYHLRRLESAGMLDYEENWGTGERYYYLHQAAREFLVKRHLL
jgi:predicted transcriptional regulator